MHGVKDTMARVGCAARVARAAVAAARSPVIATIVWLRCGPLPAGLLDESRAPSTEVYDRYGERLYEARSGAGTRSDRLDAATLPRTLVRATLAAEDVRFERHVGVDPRAIVRAAWRNMVTGRVVQGGSTITQQVAKLLVARQRAGTVDRGWRAKLHEAVIALRLEHRLSKDEILALYLNLAPYGNQIEGAERAARAYFGRPSALLTPAEAAFLAALPQQPTTFNPWREPARARQRQRRVLGAMAAQGWLPHADLAIAVQERLTLTRDRSSQIAPHFVARVLGERGTAHPRRIDTTLDATLQRAVQGVIAAHRDDLRAVIARRTWRSRCSTTAPASGWRGRDRATTGPAAPAARSTASSRPASPARR